MKFVFVLLLPIALANPLAKMQFYEYAAKHPNTDIDNPEYELIEGDIIPHEDGDTEIGEFNSIVDRNRRWPGGILHFTIRDGDFTSTELGLIQAGIDDLVSSVGQSCIDIVDRNGETAYVEVYKGSGCSSSVGRTGSRQLLSLASGCVTRHGTIMHEFLHALGFYHEQSRGDRDDFVYINFDNIQSGAENNFRKLEEGVGIDHLGTTYDYGGVMHYGAYAFAIDSSIPTIVPSDPDAEIGQRTHLSELDIERVRILYECSNAKDSKPMTKTIL